LGEDDIGTAPLEALNLVDRVGSAVHRARRPRVPGQPSASN
jgi:hypothetical protein